MGLLRRLKPLEREADKTEGKDGCELVGKKAHP
jgi:hypothetical protein